MTQRDINAHKRSKSFKKMRQINQIYSKDDLDSKTFKMNIKLEQHRRSNSM